MTTDRILEELEYLKQQVQQLRSNSTVGVLRYGQFTGIQIPVSANVPDNPTLGQFYYDEASGPVYWDGSAWIPIASPTSSLVPIGAIIIWSGSTGSIPSGFQLCNGTNGTPDLRDKFVAGAGSTYAVGASGGSATQPNHDTHSSAGGHDHADFVHTHTMGGAAIGVATGADEIVEGSQTSTGNPSTGVATEGAHTHDSHSAHGTNLPPYYALAYIQRLS